MTHLTKRLLPALLALALAASLAPGGVLAQDQAQSGEVDLGDLVDVYNANVEQAPSIARGRFAGETLEVRFGEGEDVAKKDTGTAYHFTTNDEGEITDYGEGDAESPSIRVRTSQATFEAIVNAENPAAEFNAQYEAGNVKVNGLTLTKTVEVELAKFAVWIGKTFGLF